MKYLSVIGFLGVLLLSSCASPLPELPQDKPEEILPKKIKIFSSFYPLAEFARQVGGDKVEVTNVTPAGVEPHDFEPSPQTIQKIFNSNIFIFNGNGLDPWAEKLSESFEGADTTVINISKNLDLISLEKGENNKFDPHIWLDPTKAQEEVLIIQETLIAIDPDNTDHYKERGQKYINELSSLDEKYKQSLATCETRIFVVAHSAFGYIANRYELEQTSIAGLSPDSVPSLRKLGEIVKLAEENNIKYIFFESLVSPKLAETIAQEIGAQTLILNPIEGLTQEELQSGKDYISVMEDNLENLRMALSCE